MINDFAVEPMEHVAHHLAADQSSHPLEQSGGVINGAKHLLVGEPDEAAAGLAFDPDDQEADLPPSLADLQLRPISWQSPSRIGLGLLHIIEGETESGLDEVIANVVAALSKGQVLPGGNSGPALTVLFNALGDDLVTYYGPLLEAAGADCDQIFAGQNYTFPADFERLERHIHARNVSVVVIPNAFAFLDSAINSSYDANSWPIIRGFKEVMARTGVTIILTRGMWKSSTRSTPALHKGAGSTAWAEAADVVVAVTRESDLVTIETVRLRHGDKLAPLHAEISRPSKGVAPRLVYRHDLDRDGNSEAQLAEQQERTPKKPRRTPTRSRVAPS